MPGKDVTPKFVSQLSPESFLNAWLIAWYSGVKKDFSEGSQTVVGTSGVSFLS